MFRRAGAPAVVLLAVALLFGCRNPLARQYEYSEEMYLSVDGSASVIVESSIAALVALRNAPLDPSPDTPVDREAIRRIYQEAGCDVRDVGQPWRRNGRRYVQIRLETQDIRRLSSCRPLSWSTYAFGSTPDEERGEDVLVFQQTVGAADSGDPKGVNWTGAELVAFRMHLPSRIHFHNVRLLARDEPGAIERGNILTWEQRLIDRRAGHPVSIEVRMASQSILNRTLWIFAASFGAAVATLAAAIWFTARVRGRRAPVSSGSSGGRVVRLR
jgi:hypothetical protein